MGTPQNNLDTVVTVAVASDLASRMLSRLVGSESLSDSIAGQPINLDSAADLTVQAVQARANKLIRS